MNLINVYVEIGKKKTFASAVDWPGWCRSGRDEKLALSTLIDYGPRYARVLHNQGVDFKAPEDVSTLVVTERLEGDTTTDFGAPAMMSHADSLPMDQMELGVVRTILMACWCAFDAAVERVQGEELKKGPRGGGRDLEKILQHILDGDQGYLRRLVWKAGSSSEKNIDEVLQQRREEILSALEFAVNEGLPARGPRGGIIWTPRFFVRRVAWHVLDHTWEIEDRIKNYID